MFMHYRKVTYLIYSFLFLATPSVFGQENSYDLPDSLKKALTRLPESMHDSIYSLWAVKLYELNTYESHTKAIDFNKKALALSEKYNHKIDIVGITHAIGEIYDFRKELPESLLYYYKKAYESSEGCVKDKWRMYMAFDVAYAYSQLRDIPQCEKYVAILNDFKNRLFKKGDEEWDNVNLLMADLALRNNNIPQFMTLFEAVNKERVYKNGRFPFKQYMTFCLGEYYRQKHEYNKCIDLYLAALKTAELDSAEALQHLSKDYATIGKFKEAFEIEKTFNQFKMRTVKVEKEKDFTVKLLKTENELKEKDKQLRDKQNQYLLGGLLFALVSMFFMGYFWYTNRKSKIELAKRNAEKEILVHEIHHRVKNNLQLLYSLATLQLPTILDEKAKDLWQKNLNQLKTMSLVNEKLYNTEGVTSFELKDFVNDLVEHFKVLKNDDIPTRFNIDMQGDLNVNADFAVPFGLILSELITNTYKHAPEESAISIAVHRENEKALVFQYSDNGKVVDITQITQKKIGGSALITDLVRQLKGKFSISNETHLQYNFAFTL